MVSVLGTLLLQASSPFGSCASLWAPEAERSTAVSWVVSQRHKPHLPLLLRFPSPFSALPRCGCLASGSEDKRWQAASQPLCLEELRQCCPPSASAASATAQNNLPGLRRLLQAGPGLPADKVVSLGHLKQRLCMSGSSDAHPQVNTLCKALVS